MTVAPLHGSRAGWLLADSVTLLRRYLAHLRHRPFELAGTLGFPILMVLMFAFLLGGMMAVPGGGDYRQALLPGMYAMTMLFGMSTTMLAVVTDARLGITDRFRSMPMSPAAVLLGRAVADMVIATIALVVMLLAGPAVGWRADGISGVVGAVALLVDRHARRAHGRALAARDPRPVRTTVRPPLPGDEPMTETSRISRISRIKPPSWIKGMNEGLLEQQRQGTAEFDLPVLTVPGRRSGEPRHTPLTVLDQNGQRFVLGGFPAADWIRNVRAAGEGVLRVGGVEERVRLVELDAVAALPVLRAWPAVTPEGVAMMRDAGVITDTTPEALATVAGICPVFRVERVA
ncbi:nitroreductase/quinone reductase family protein [Pseudonocardia sp. GCM10023141]|uniref:nitroreductase/quinone reductase family protein n=1 Tax=Pseudonocardia sp. GCM10023141 TaxID=3252653 RepID=UPI00361EDBB8